MLPLGYKAPLHALAVIELPKAYALKEPAMFGDQTYKADFGIYQLS